MEALRTILPDFDDKLYGAQSFLVDGYTVTLFVNRVTDEKYIKKHNKNAGLTAKPPAVQHIKKFGFRIDLAHDAVKIYRNPTFEISEGGKRWVFNVKRPLHKVSILYAVSLEVYKNDEPVNVKFESKHQIDAALAVYERRIKEAQIELRDELHRIAMISIDNVVPKPQPRKRILKKG